MDDQVAAVILPLRVIIEDAYPNTAE
jgi:hypothetical protein